MRAPIAEYISSRLERFRSSLAGFGVNEHAFASSFEVAIDLALSDLAAMANNDPAARRNEQFVWDSYGSIRAIVDYRVAHAIDKFGQSVPGLEELFSTIAREMSEECKQRSGIEIHPKAMIGSAFRVDHGYGVVIGETAIIGDECVLLQGVTIGARGTSVMSTERRHPQIGNRVEICSFAKVLGPISVGDDCFIGPDCVIVDHLEPETQVKRVLGTQVTRSRRVTTGRSFTFYGFVPHPNEPRTACIHGRNLTGLRPQIVDREDLDVLLVDFDFEVHPTHIVIYNAKPLRLGSRSRPLLLLRYDNGSTTHWMYDTSGLDDFYGDLLK